MVTTIYEVLTCFWLHIVIEIQALEKSCNWDFLLGVGLMGWVFLFMFLWVKGI